MENLFAENLIFRKHGAARADCEMVLVVGDGDALLGGHGLITLIRGLARGAALIEWRKTGPGAGFVRLGFFPGRRLFACRLFRRCFLRCCLPLRLCLEISQDHIQCRTFLHPARTVPVHKFYMLHPPLHSRSDICHSCTRRKTSMNLQILNLPGRIYIHTPWLQEGSETCQSCNFHTVSTRCEHTAQHHTMCNWQMEHCAHPDTCRWHMHRTLSMATQTFSRQCKICTRTH